MKSLTIAIIATVFGLAPALSQNAALTAVIDSTLQIMKAHSVNKKSVDWALLRKKVLAASKNAENGYQLGDAFRLMLKETHEFHGAIFVGDSTFRWVSKAQDLSDSIKNEWKKGVTLQSKMLAGNIGYIRVPYMSNDNKTELDKKAQMLNDSLCTLLSSNARGIVIDLRLNGGGVMYPMMLGLEQILGQGEIGSFTSGKSDRWLLKNDAFYIDTLLMTSIIPKCQIAATSMPVAVLIGPATGSSGEFLTMSFKGRNNTIFIGEKTAGYITATKGFSINDAVFVLISTCYGRDRKGRPYLKAIAPDIYANYVDSFNDIDHDQKIVKAKWWIQSHVQYAVRK